MPSLVGKTKHLKINPTPRPVALAAVAPVTHQRSIGLVETLLGLFRSRR